MRNLVIFSNNPDLQRAYPEIVQYTAQDVRKIFIAVRDAVHDGARILSHPLAGSVKPWESPYKSVILSAERGVLDFASVQLIENALAQLDKPTYALQDYNESTLADFRIIDMDLMQSALQSLT